MIKVAMLIDGRAPVFGGGQVHVKNLSELLVKNHNCTVDLFVRKLKGSKGEKGIKNEIKLDGKFKIFRIGPTASFFNPILRSVALINTFFFLFFKTLKERYDIIHAHAYVSGFPAKVIGYIFKIPVIYTVNGTMGLDAKRRGLFYFLEKWLVMGIKYDLEISVSHNILDYKNINKNIKIIYNGVNIEEYDSVNIDKKHNGIQMLFVGRFGWQKGLEYLIEGLSLVDKKRLVNEGFKLNLVGDGELLSKLKKMVEVNGLKDFVDFKGSLFGDNLIKEYKKNHIFMLPSLAEGQPLTILESFAAKLPVITTNAGDNTYFIYEGKTGYMIPQKDPVSIKNIIEKILKTDKGDFKKMGVNGYNLVLKNNTRDIIVDKIYKEYNILLKNTKKGEQ